MAKAPQLRKYVLWFQRLHDFDGGREAFQVFLDGKKTPEPDLGSEPTPTGEVSHFRNFFDAVQAGKPEMLTAEINETYLSTAFCLLGNISYRLKRELIRSRCAALHRRPRSRRHVEGKVPRPVHCTGKSLKPPRRGGRHPCGPGPSHLRCSQAYRR